MESTESSFDIGHYLHVARRRRALLVLAPLVCAVGSYLLAADDAERFRATSQVRVIAETIDTEVQLVTSEPVRQAVETAVGGDLDGLESIDARRLEETELVDITVSATSADRAAELANAWATTFAEYRNDEAVRPIEEDRAALLESAAGLSVEIVDVQTRINQLEQQLQLLGEGEEDTLEPTISAELVELQTRLARLEADQADLNERAAALETEALALSRTLDVVDTADPPGGPYAPKPVRSAVVGLLAGAVLGLFAAALAELLDDPVWDNRDLDRWTGGLPVLAQIPPFPRRLRTVGQPVTMTYPRHATSEAYRVLRTAVQFQSMGQTRHRIMITSADAGDGKTTTAVNLGVVSAAAGADVLVVDGDLRRGSVHENLGLPDDIGLSTVLYGTSSLEEATIRVFDSERGQLHALPAGPLAPDPAELITSADMKDLLAAAERAHDTVIIDTPPILAVSDAFALAEFVDGAVLVVRARRSRGRSVAAAVERMERSGVTILGAVLNDHREHHSPYNVSYYATHDVPRRGLPGLVARVRRAWSVGRVRAAAPTHDGDDPDPGVLDAADARARRASEPPSTAVPAETVTPDETTETTETTDLDRPQTEATDTEPDATATGLPPSVGEPEGRTVDVPLVREERSRRKPRTAPDGEHWASWPTKRS